MHYPINAKKVYTNNYNNYNNYNYT